MEEPEERAQRRARPARPLFGYRDVGEDVRGDASVITRGGAREAVI
jgi:hypothetical protein